MTKMTQTLRPTTKVRPPVETRWGRRTACVEMADGLWHVTAESGRGFWISAERRDALPESWRTVDRFYAEIAEWSALALQLREEFAGFYGDDILAEAERVFREAFDQEPPRMARKPKAVAAD